jgi:polysaccharide export outer membrane protein
MQGAGQIGLIDNPNALLSLPLTTNNAPPNSYLVRSDGTVALPMVGDVTLKGLKLYQADSLLALLYNQFYDSTFVVTQYLNKRVVLMGALGDKVVPIRNENMTLLEVLAMAGNFQMAAKANSLRVIRGDLSAPSVQFIDLTTIEGMRKANLFVQPNDVIYVEPRRRIDRETIADINSLVAPITTLITVILSITLLIQQLERN